MTPFRILFLCFLFVPLAELYFLIQVGSVIGVAWTILIVIMTAFLGAHLLKQQGMQTLQRFQGSLQQARLPATEIVEGVILLACGALLLTPGFITDALGFAMLVPVIRQTVAGFILSHFKPNIVTSHGFTQHKEPPHDQQQPKQSGRTIEGDYHRD